MIPTTITHRIGSTLCFLGCFTLVGCAPKADVGHVADSDAHTWTYEGETGPTHWGALNAEWAACSAGRVQSPINLTAAALSDLADPVFTYQSSPLSETNNGHTAQASYAAGSSLQVDGKIYQLLQFHFHSASEHTIDGAHTPLEVHLVHQAADGSLAVVGLLVEEGSSHPAFDAVLAAIPVEEGVIVSPEGIKVNANDFLPAQRTTYRYEGSLTTPPCSEGVTWLIMTQKIQLSAEQIAQYVSLFPGTNRPIQPLNERTLSQDAS